MNSSVTFNDLIQNIYPADEMSAGDNYYIYAKPTDGKNVAYQPTKFSWNSCPFNDCFQDFQFDINMGNYVEQEMDLAPYQMSLAVSGKLKRVFANDDGSPNMTNAKPLANMPIKLVGQWVIKNDADGIVYPINGNSNDFAAGTTDGDGQFSLNTGNTTFYQLGENGVNQYQNSTGNFYDKNGNAKPVSGKEYYVLRIKVQSPYYYSPDNDLLVEPGYNYDLGDMLANVREANVQVDGLKAVNTDLGINDVGGILNPIKKSGERVYLCVNPKKLPDGFPINENKLFGLSKKEIVDGLTYQVIDEATTTSGGKFLFKHVVLNDLQNAQDRYYYFTESTEQSFDNYSSEIINAFSAINDNENEQKTFWNSTQFIKEYNAQKDLHQTTLTTSVYTWAQTPVIMGAVYPNSNYSTNPLQAVTVEVYDIPEAAVNESTFGNNGFSGAWFKGTICSKYGATPEASMQTGMNGKFQFNVNTNDKTKSGRKLVFFSKNGFTPTGVFVNGGAKIKRGEKAALSKIFMELPATVLGKVVDADDGNFIHAKVVVGDDFSWSETNETFGSIKVGDMFVPTLFPVSQTLTMSAPYAKGVKFTAYPDDNDTYEPLTVYQDINFFGDQPKITFKLKHRQHHIIIKAHSPGSDYVANNIPVKATIINGSQQVTSIDETVWENDNNGTKHAVHRAKLEFASSAKTFLVKLESQTSGSCFESKIVSIDDDAKYTNIFNFELKPCKKVLCHVTDKGQPAVNVKIYVEDLPFTVPVAYTDINGDAELMGVPADGTHNIVAIPPTTMKNYFGSTKAVNMSSYQGAKIKLTVSKFDMMDISSLLGFPIEVKNITFGIGPNTGKIFISGSMLVNNANNYFSIPSVLVTSSDAIKNNNFDFENIEIVASTQKAASGLPLAVPKNDFWSTTQSKNIKVFNSYGGFSYSAFGAFVKKLSDNSGKIQSPLFIDGANFKKGFSVKDAANSMYISTSNYNGKTLGYDVAEFLDLYNSDGTTPTSLTSSFKVSTWDYKNVWYLLHNKYAGEAKVAGSTFDKDGLHLNTMLHTNIPQLASPDINVNVGNIDIDKNETHGTSGSSLTIPMDKWKFAVKDWTLTSNGLNATGSIVAGALTVPATNVLIDYSRFNYGTYDVEKIKLGGNIPLNLDKNNTSVSFGFDAGYGTNGAWSLSMLPLKGDVLMSLNGLPGLASNDVINLKNISLYSRGSDDENVIMLSETTPWVTVNSVSKFHPAMAFATTGAINFRGKLDLQIPKMSELTDAFTMRYEATGNGLKLAAPDAPFNGLSMNTKGVIVNFNSSNQVFQNNNLVLHGKIQDQNSSVNYKFDVTLTKTNSATIIAVDNTNQKFVYSGGTSGLEKITGAMNVISNNSEWNNFSFEGDLFGLEGIADAKKHMNFTVKGDLVADNQKVGVKNLAVDGLGSGSITYDFGQKALIGNLHIEQDLSNCHLSSDVDLKFGGGDWYVFGSAIATNIQNSPVSSGKCGFFVGKGTISGNIQNVLAQYFYKNVLPDPFPKGSYTGALFCTEAAVPVPIIPQININLDPIVHCTLEHAIHLNSYTGISLGYPKISYDLGGQAYVYIHAGAGASVGIACCGADLSATGGAGVYGHIDLNIPSPSINPVQMMSDAKSAIMNANITMQGEVFLDLQGSAYVGGGLCDSDCDGWFCETTSWSKGMDIRLAATYKKGDGVKLEFKDLHFH